ncbi:MAG: small multi-drug export protein [Calditrichota bacterium]
MTDKLAHFFSWLEPQYLTAVLAALPITELRGALPWALFMLKMPWPQAFFWSVLGNLIPVPFILLLLEPMQKLLCRWSVMERFFTWLFARTRRRGKLVEKYRAIGLMLFVAVPLPVTGAWTGAAAAFVFGIRFWPALFAIIGGVLIAGVIVTSLCLMGVGFTDLARQALTAP